MPAQTIIDNEFATLVYHPDARIVHHTFHKPIGGDDFRHVLLNGVELLKQHSASKWLSDDRANAALSDEDTRWAETVWFPQSLAAGWKHWALVVPQDLKGRLNMKEFVDMYYEQGIRVMVFTDPAKALDWLKAQ